MSSKTAITCALLVFASLFIFVFWSGNASPGARGTSSSSSSSTVTVAPSESSTSPPSTSTSEAPGETEQPVATPNPTLELRPSRSPKLDATPLFFPPSSSSSRDGDDTALLAASAVKPRRTIRLTTSTTVAATTTTSSSTANTTTGGADGMTTTTAILGTATTTSSPSSPPVVSGRPSPPLFATHKEGDRPDYAWNAWTLVPRILAEEWWAANFGAGWKCGVGNHAAQFLVEKILDEIVDYAKKFPQRNMGVAAWGPIMHINWNASTLLYDSCAPRSPETRRIFGLTTDGDTGMTSITRPALGAVCLRAFMVLDRRAPSLEVAMSRRCFKKFASKNNRQAQVEPKKDDDSSSSSLSSIIASIPSFSVPFVVGLGHSHTRYLLAMLCMSADLPWCSDFDAIQRLPFYPKDVRNVFGGVAPSFDSGTKNSLSKMRELERDRNLLASPHTHALKLGYVSSYYDQRFALVRLLAWLGAASASSSSAGGSTAELLMESSKIPHGAKPDFSSAAYGLIGVPSASSSDADFGENEKDEKKQNMIDEEILSWARGTILPKLKRAPTHFVLSRGEWDMLYFDPDPWMLMLQMERGISLIMNLFSSSTTVILQLPQVHVPSFPAFSTARSKTKWGKLLANAQWRNRCSSDARRLLLRHVNLCAASRALSKRDKPEDEQSRLLLFDSDRVTKSHLGNTFVDGTGHHYIDEALEVLALEMRRIVERPDVANVYAAKSREMLLDKGGAGSCEFVKRAALEFRDPQSYQNTNRLFAKCTCHRDEPLDAPFCKSTRILSRNAG